MSYFTPHQKKFLDHIRVVEGGYVNDVADSGGETKYGVTKVVARRCGYLRDMRDLTVEEAERILLKMYWHTLALDNVAELDADIAFKLADIGVNMGTGRAAEFLQRSLNALNNGGSMYPDLKVDGAIGPRTTGVLCEFLRIRKQHGPVVMLRMLNCLQGSFYVDLAERRQKDEKFLFGWMLNRVEGF